MAAREEIHMVLIEAIGATAVLIIVHNTLGKRFFNDDDVTFKVKRLYNLVKKFKKSRRVSETTTIAHFNESYFAFVYAYALYHNLKQNSKKFH